MFVSQHPPPPVLTDAGMCGSQQDASACNPQRSPFTTTQSFTTTHGFVISTPPSSCLPPAAAVPSRSSSSCSEYDSSGSGGAASNNKQQQQEQQQQAGEQASTPVGWSGLLEISRSGCCPPGLVGSAACSWEEELGSQGHIEVACTAHASTGVRRLVKAVIRGLKARQEPEAARDGMGGTYFFTNEAGRKVAIFKPCDEEPLAPANPKGYVGRALGDPGWKATVRVGEAAMREVAAYLLDHGHFARVPHTVLVQAQHPVFNYTYAPAAAGGGGGGGGPLPMSSSSLSMASMSTTTGGDLLPGGGDAGAGSSSGGRALKLGSLQEFVYHIADTADFGAGRFRPRDVHAIGILDLRLFNTDRHAGNILVLQPQPGGGAGGAFGGGAGAGTLGSRPPSLLSAAAAAVSSASQYELVPIDHGFCLPEALDAPYFEWLHWPQACLPFSAEELAYIEGLDAAADVALLQRELPNLRPECLRVLEVSTTLLQACAAAGLSLADIGALASRPLDALDGDDSPSELEKACIAARQAVETRELAAVLSSSFSSDDTFTVREEAEEDLVATSDLEEEEEEPQQDCGRGGDGTGGAKIAVDDVQQLLLQRQQQQLHPQRRPRSPSRLGGPAPCVGARGGGPAAAQQQQQRGLGGNGGDLASPLSEGTVCNLAASMSLGSRAPDVDLLFDLDDESGSSAANTPMGSSGGNARTASPLGRPPAGAATAAAAAATAAPGEDGDVVMAAAGSMREDDAMEAEALAEFVSSVQLGTAAAAAGPAPPASLPSSGGGSASAAAAGPPGRAPSTPQGGSGSGPGGPCSLAVARSVQVGGAGGVGGGGRMLFGEPGGPGAALRARAMRPGFTPLTGRGGAGGGGGLRGKPGAAVAIAARRRTGVSHAMYPPPVVRAAPRAANEVLRGLSEEQWAAFMRELRAHMDAALTPGTGAWRRASQAAGLGAAAMSCPRF